MSLRASADPPPAELRRAAAAGLGNALSAAVAASLDAGLGDGGEDDVARFTLLRAGECHYALAGLYVAMLAAKEAPPGCEGMQVFCFVSFHLSQGASLSRGAALPDAAAGSLPGARPGALRDGPRRALSYICVPHASRPVPQATHQWWCDFCSHVR